LSSHLRRARRTACGSRQLGQFGGFLGVIGAPIRTLSDEVVERELGMQGSVRALRVQPRVRGLAGRMTGYISIFSVMVMSLLLSKELMDLVALLLESL
jgi:hypothetical protein